MAAIYLGGVTVSFVPGALDQAKMGGRSCGANGHDEAVGFSAVGRRTASAGALSSC